MLPGARTIQGRLQAVQERVVRAAQRAGRSFSEVALVAVVKNVPPPLVLEARRAGAVLFGENRIQDAAARRAELSDIPVSAWHMIGHLQTNKARKAAELFETVQSLDSVRLAETLDKEGERRGRPVACLVEVKLSPEPTKHGLPSEELDDFLARSDRWPHLRLEGLMTVAPHFDDAELTRPFFQKARALFERNLARFRGEPRLSMGMSQDFEVAVEEGSNMVRIGTAIFGERP